MKDILDKLSPYNLFNHLVPGVIFATLTEYLTKFKFIHDNIVIAAFIFYFIGQILGRIGSLIIEPALKMSSFVQFAEYLDYVTASKKDPLLETLSEINNSYRNYCSLFLLLMLLKGYEVLATRFSVVRDLAPYLLLIGLFALFLFAYQKQTQYIASRVRKANSDN